MKDASQSSSLGALCQDREVRFPLEGLYEHSLGVSNWAPLPCAQTLSW